MYGRCHHRGALLADGHIDGQNLICGVHGWDYRYDTGVSEYNNDEALHRFAAVVDEEADAVWVDAAEVAAFADGAGERFRDTDAEARAEGVVGHAGVQAQAHHHHVAHGGRFG